MNITQISKYVAIVIGFVVVVFLIYSFSSIVTYVLISWVVSLLGQPIFTSIRELKLGKLRMGPSISALLTLLSLLLIFILLFWLFVPLVVAQAGNLSNLDYQGIFSAIQEPVNQVISWFATHGFDVSEESLSQDFENTLSQWVNPDTVSAFFGSLIGFLGNFLIGIFSVFFISFFFLKEENLFTGFLSSLVPRRHENKIVHAMEQTSQLLTRYFSGILVQITIITIFVSIALWLLGVKNALLIGVFAAFINVIPYLGPMLGAIFGVFITISTNLDPPLDFYSELLPLISKVVAVFAVMQLVDNFILQPYIFSNSVKAHPLEIFIVILIGAQIGGIPGMILAIPGYTVLRVILKTFLSEFKLVQKITGGLE